MKQKMTLTIDSKVKEMVGKILKERGMKMSSVVEIYLNKFIKENAKPKK